MRTILIVDDEPGIRVALRRILEKADYCVHEVQDGAACHLMMRELQPDLVLLDVRMPGLDGIEVLREMRRHSIPSDVPVMLLNGMKDMITCVQGYAADADDFLHKPPATTEVLARVEVLLRRRARSSTAHDPTLDGAIRLGEKICDMVESQLEFITVSIGATGFVPGSDSGPSSLHERVDQALYRAKRNGRTRVEVIGPEWLATTLRLAVGK